jgi:hypothetical protein
MICRTSIGTLITFKIIYNEIRKLRGLRVKGVKMKKCGKKHVFFGWSFDFAFQRCFVKLEKVLL